MKKSILLAFFITFIMLKTSNAYRWPTNTTIITDWYGNRDSYTTTNGNKASGFHEAIDIGAAKGSPCYAVGNGKINIADYNQYNGNYIVLELENGCLVYYLHLSQLDVTKGESVTEGQVIGKTGDTGNVTGPHLCFRVKKNGVFMNLNSYVKAYLNGTSMPSGTVESNVCQDCKAQIGAAWHTSVDGKHYRVCLNNHKNEEGYHVFEQNSNKCKVCDLDTMVTVGIPHSGSSLIINLNNKNIRKETVEKIVINVKEKQYLIWEENITSFPLKQGDQRTLYKEIITQNGSQIQVTDERVAIIIPQGSEESKILGDGKTKNTLDIAIYTTGVVFHSQTVINGNEAIDTELVIETKILGESLLIDMNNININRDNVDWIGINANGKGLVWEGNITKLPVQQTQNGFCYKEVITQNGSKIQVMEDKVSVIIPKGTVESTILGDIKTRSSLDIKIGCLDNVNLKGKVEILGNEPIDTNLKVSTPISENALIIDMDNANISRDKVEWISITANGEGLAWENNITSLPVQQQNGILYKEKITQNGSQLLVVDGRVSLVMPQGSLESKILGSGEMKEVKIEISCRDLSFTGKVKIIGIEASTDMIDQPSNGTSNEQTNGTSNEQIEIKLFSDLPVNHWAMNEIKAMKELGIVNGRTDGTLGVEDKITVEEFFALVSRVVKTKGLAKVDGKVYLEDLIANEWSYSDYVTLLQVIGAKYGETENIGKRAVQLILGGTDTSDDGIRNMYKGIITRERAAALIGLFIDGESVSTSILPGVKDWNEVNSTYRVSLNKLIINKMLNGVPKDDGVYILPKEGIKRGEAIALIYRLHNVNNN